VGSKLALRILDKTVPGDWIAAYSDEPILVPDPEFIARTAPVRSDIDLEADQ
jgi:hypothetical protein